MREVERRRRYKKEIAAELPRGRAWDYVQRLIERGGCADVIVDQGNVRDDHVKRGR